MKTIKCLKTYYELYIKDYKYIPLAIIALPVLMVILIDAIISDVPSWVWFLLIMYIIFN